MSGSPSIIFLGGKGGVGKTTLAAATALALADTGLRTLLVSTDPAHSLGDVFQSRLGDRPTRLTERLWVAEPDAEAAVRRRVREVTDDAYAALPRTIMPAVQRHLTHAAAGPGMRESALSDQLLTLMAEVPATWDRLVVDSAPTGHLLRMLSLPALLTPWIQGLARQRERVARADRLATGIAEEHDDPLLERLHARRRRLEEATGRLRDDALVRLVLVPRRMVLAESERAAARLVEEGVSLGTVIINQVPPDPDHEVLRAARERFAAHGVTEIPFVQHEPTGIARLRELARLLG